MVCVSKSRQHIYSHNELAFYTSSTSKRLHTERFCWCAFNYYGSAHVTFQRDGQFLCMPFCINDDFPSRDFHFPQMLPIHFGRQFLQRNKTFQTDCFWRLYRHKIHSDILDSKSDIVGSRRIHVNNLCMCCAGTLSVSPFFNWSDAVVC